MLLEVFERRVPRVIFGSENIFNLRELHKTSGTYKMLRVDHINETLQKFRKLWLDFKKLQKSSGTIFKLGHAFHRTSKNVVELQNIQQNINYIHKSYENFVEVR